MRFKLHKTPSTVVAELQDEKLVVCAPGDFLSLMMEAGQEGASTLALHETNIVPGFFDLRTGIAGEILQKVVNYGFKLAIVGDVSRYTEKSESLRALIRESNRGRDVTFAGTLDEILTK